MYNGYKNKGARKGRGKKKSRASYGKRRVKCVVKTFYR